VNGVPAGARKELITAAWDKLKGRTSLEQIKEIERLDNLFAKKTTATLDQFFGTKPRRVPAPQDQESPQPVKSSKPPFQRGLPCWIDNAIKGKSSEFAAEVSATSREPQADTRPYTHTTHRVLAKHRNVINEFMSLVSEYEDNKKHAWKKHKTEAVVAIEEASAAEGLLQDCIEKLVFRSPQFGGSLDSTVGAPRIQADLFVETLVAYTVKINKGVVALRNKVKDQRFKKVLIRLIFIHAFSNVSNNLMHILVKTFATSRDCNWMLLISEQVKSERKRDEDDGSYEIFIGAGFLEKSWEQAIATTRLNMLEPLAQGYRHVSIHKKLSELQIARLVKAVVQFGRVDLKNELVAFPGTAAHASSYENHLLLVNIAKSLCEHFPIIYYQRGTHAPLLVDAKQMNCFKNYATILEALESAAAADNDEGVEDDEDDEDDEDYIDTYDDRPSKRKRGRGAPSLREKLPQMVGAISEFLQVQCTC
jgi:hypothetical protein